MEKVHNSKKGVWIAVLITVVVAVLATAGILFYNLVWNSPAVRLTKGFTNLASELAQYQNPLLKEIDYNTMVQSMESEPFTTDMELNITIPAVEELGTIGMDVRTNTDKEKKQTAGEFVFSTYNIDLLEVEFAVDDDRLYLGLPNLISKTYYVNGDTLGRDYHASIWPGILDLQVAEDLSYDFFPEEEVTEDILSGEFIKMLEENGKSIAETMVVEYTEEPYVRSVDGKDVKCKGIRIVLDEESVNEFLADLKEELEKQDAFEDEELEVLSWEVEEDIELCVYLDNKNRIVRICTPEGLYFADSVIESLEVDILFWGEERNTDIVECKMVAETAEATMQLDLESRMSAEKESSESQLILSMQMNEVELFYVDYGLNWDYEEETFSGDLLVTADGSTYEMEVEGGFSDIVTGERFAMEIGSLKMKVNEKEVCRINGSMEIALSEEAVTIPENATDFFGMSEAEMIELAEEIYQSPLKYIQ